MILKQPNYNSQTQILFIFKRHVLTQKTLARCILTRVFIQKSIQILNKYLSCIMQTGRNFFY
jgi:hypothetical protein